MRFYRQVVFLVCFWEFGMYGRFSLVGPNLTLFISFSKARFTWAFLRYMATHVLVISLDSALVFSLLKNKSFLGKVGRNIFVFSKGACYLYVDGFKNSNIISPLAYFQKQSQSRALVLKVVFNSVHVTDSDPTTAQILDSPVRARRNSNSFPQARIISRADPKRYWYLR